MQLYYVDVCSFANQFVRWSFFVNSYSNYKELCYIYSYADFLKRNMLCYLHVGIFKCVYRVVLISYATCTSPLANYIQVEYETFSLYLPSI